MADKNRIAVTAQNTWLSTTAGAVSPADGALSLTVVSALTSGSVVTFHQRLKAAANDGVAGAWDTVKKIVAADMGSAGSLVTHFTGLPDVYEFDVGVATGDYQAGDTGLVLQLIGK